MLIDVTTYDQNGAVESVETITATVVRSAVELAVLLNGAIHQKDNEDPE